MPSYFKRASGYACLLTRLCKLSFIGWKNHFSEAKFAPVHGLGQAPIIPTYDERSRAGRKRSSLVELVRLSLPPDDLEDPDLERAHGLLWLWRMGASSHAFQHLRPPHNRTFDLSFLQVGDRTTCPSRVSIMFACGLLSRL
jgi:hypothetical protein